MSKKNNKPNERGKYRTQVYTGKDPSGRRQYKVFYGNTQSEADAKAREYKAAIDKGIDVAAADDSFAKWSERWLRVKKKLVGNSQFNTYKSLLKHLNSEIGNMPIKEIRLLHIQDLLENLAEEKELSHKTLKEIRGTASQVFNYAIDNRALEYNPASRAVIPGSAKIERQPITAEQQAMITFFPHRMQAPAMIMLYAGLRRGEVIPLEWSDVDFDNQTITVNKAVDLTDNQPVVKPPKTKAGNRVIVINQILLNFLRKHQEENNSKYVCPSLNGEMFTQTAWSRAWSSYLYDLDTEYGTERKSKYDPQYKNPNSDKNHKGSHTPNLVSIEPFTAQQLRHTFATNLVQSGINPKEAQIQIGHSSITTTLDIYTHLSDEHIKKEMQKYNDYTTDRLEYLESLIK